MANTVLTKAKRQKSDEFYTQLSDIEKELKNYKHHFKNKVVFCNCDDPEWSNFYYYFVSNFEELKLKKLITTHFEVDKPSYKLEYEGGADVKADRETVIKRSIELGKKSKLKQNFEQGTQGELFENELVLSYSGDFRSPECIELLKQSDIIITNPPFSLFREYVEQIVTHNKLFLIIGDLNAISYKEIFKYIKE
ncbi:MAG: adenine-specific methyltransferase EcoRI family protein, partial [Deferribacteraceae bacterium]|nr:adenine-specific methyltransferase EcoRI family protein [Deferribacteraceae bacterium]